MNSPPYTTSTHASPSNNSQTNPIEPQMRSLLASTWQVLEQPPPPTLREILAAYKSRGDGDREMLLAMLNAKSAEDQRLASTASLHRTILEIRQTTEPASPPQFQQLVLTNGTHHPHPNHAAPNHHYPHPHAPSPYSSPAQSQQMVYSPPQAHAQPHDSPAPSPKVTLPAIRGRPSSGRSAGSSDAHARRKRARHSHSPYEPPRHQPERHHAEPPQSAASLHDFPPSPYSSASQRSLSSESSTHPHRERGAMAIGSLLSSSSGAPSKVKDDREELWNGERERERERRRGSRDDVSRNSKTS